MPTTWWVETTGNDTTGSGTSGAPYATIGKALSVAASGDTIAVQTGTYVVTSTMAITQSTITIQGFAVTPGDGGTKPLITTATNGVVLFDTGSSNGGYQIWDNLSMSNTAATRASGIWQSSAHGTTQWWICNKCVFDGFTTAVDSSDNVPDDVAFIALNGCEIKNCTVAGVATSNGVSNNFCAKIQGCYFHGNNVDILDQMLAGTLIVLRCIFSSAATTSISVGSIRVFIEHNSFYNVTGKDLLLTANSTFMSIDNNLFWQQDYAIYGVTNNTATAAAASSRNNAYGNSVHSNLFDWNGSPGDVVLTASPYNNAGAGDFSLNGTAGGGAACRGAGFPGVFPGGTSTEGLDIGAVQTATPSSSGGGSFAFVV
jgi:hypothetical protein